MSVGVIQCFYLAPGAPEERGSCCQGDAQDLTSEAVLAHPAEGQAFEAKRRSFWERKP